MIPQAMWKTGRSGWAATLVLLTWEALSPSAADASCGDYVMIGGRHAVHDAVPQPHERRGDATQQVPAVPRCHGPLCSNNSIPPAAPARKIEVTVEHWAVSGSDALAVLPNRDDLPADAHALPCDGFGRGILRPPR
jgi:hypothetical protein